MIKAILLDVDDTLIKTFETKKEALKSLGRKYYDTELSDDEIRLYWGKPIRELLQALYRNIDDVEEAFERYVLERKNYPTKPYTDTVNTLQALAKKKLLGLITSKSKRYIDEESHVHKPDPYVFNYALSKLEKKGISRSEVLYVGDTLSDYYAARDAGLDFYGVYGRTMTKKEFEREGAKTIRSLSDLISLVK